MNRITGKLLPLLLVLLSIATTVPCAARAASGPLVSAAADHTLLLDSDGTVWGWGGNGSGQLGIDNKYSSSNVPVQATGISGITAVATGSFFSVALKNDGTVWTWGRNGAGQLGDGSNASQSNVPVEVHGSGDTGFLDGVVAISAGTTHVLALKSNGTVWAWGLNNLGQLGCDPATTPSSNLPIQVAGLTNIIAIAAENGSHSLAVQSDGTVWAWGNNEFGQLGDNTTGGSRYTPAQVKGSGGSGVLGGVIKIATGWIHSMALLDDGTVRAWGANGKGELGDGTTTSRPAPVQVAGLVNVTAIAAGRWRSYALFNGTLYGWGNNTSGNIGDGTTMDRHTPVLVDIIKVITIASGQDHNVAVTADGRVWTWSGFNSNGLLGDGTSTACYTPMPITGRTVGKITAIAGGQQHSAAVESEGSVWTWGSNLSGQLGTGNYTGSHIPVRTASGMTAVSSVTAGSHSTLALAGNSTVYSWGDNSKGQLGTGDTTGRATPGFIGLPQVTLTGFKSIASRADSTIVLKGDGKVWAWGNNSANQLGTAVSNLAPGQSWFVLLHGVTAIAAGGNHTVALLSDGTLRSWGDNLLGQLGDGTYVDSTTAPKQVNYPGMYSILVPQQTVTAIAAGYDHTLALLADGAVKSWGYNGNGQLGDGSTTNRNSAVQVKIGSGSLTGVRAIAAGLVHSLALLDDGTVWAWGNNSSGQLGDGSLTDRHFPVQVKYGGSPGQPLTGVVAIAAGHTHSMALLSDGSMVAWGTNFDGQLGDNTTSYKTSPVATFPISADAGPSVRIISGPDYYTPLGSGTIIFAASQLNSTFVCSMDYAPFTACTSPYQFDTKVSGHIFRVKATNSAGLTGPVAISIWALDVCGFRIGDNCYTLFDDAYAAVLADETIMVKADALTYPLACNRADDVSFTLVGGYDASYTAPPAGTTVFPALTISRGRITARNLIIRPAN